jgi:ubiquinone/menaquinone biosynthesis C-methylase UbiE
MEGGRVSANHYTDQSYLLGEQYRDAANLSARMALHKRFSTTRQGWQQWLFEQLDLPADANVIELGCGNGALWWEKRERVPSGWRLTLTDLSPGMVAEARERLRELPQVVAVQTADIQALAFADGAFDAAMANHMLYHVLDVARALSEAQRVLRPGGHFYAATNGPNHMRELDDLVRNVAPGFSFLDPSAHFGLESGRAQLEPWFARVELRRYPDALEVTDVDALLAYIHSTYEGATLTEPQLARLRELAAGEIARRGAFHVTKDVGLFCCVV